MGVFKKSALNIWRYAKGTPLSVEWLDKIRVPTIVTKAEVGVDGTGPHQLPVTQHINGNLYVVRKEKVG